MCKKFKGVVNDQVYTDSESFQKAVLAAISSFNEDDNFKMSMSYSNCDCGDDCDCHNENETCGCGYSRRVETLDITDLIPTDDNKIPAIVVDKAPYLTTKNKKNLIDSIDKEIFELKNDKKKILKNIDSCINTMNELETNSKKVDTRIDYYKDVKRFLNSKAVVKTPEETKKSNESLNNFDNLDCDNLSLSAILELLR